MSKNNYYPEAINDAVKNLTDKPTQIIGVTLADIWYLVFGGISQSAEKRKLKYAYALKEFENELKKKSSMIPANNRVEPDFQIIGPALESSKYCIMHKELRDMFSSLISSSLDATMCNYVHPSFAEIIKQLTPLDAQNLMIFKEKSYRPICNYRVNFTDHSYDDYYTNVFLSNPNILNIQLQSISMSSLSRLGLVHINFECKTKYYKYEAFSQTKEYKQLLDDVAMHIIPKSKSIDIIKGIIELTPYGIAFIKCCVE